MRREFERLSRGPFDLLVIGGGIYGSWMAYDAALRGLSVALVEERDWAAGTSSASSKLVHGGLRYLAQRRMGLVRLALAERSRLAGLAPHRVRRTRFVLPVARQGPHGKLSLRLGMWLYDRMGAREKPFEPSTWLDRRRLAQRCPYLSAAAHDGGFLYDDCITDDARLTLEVVDGAAEAGAAVANHALVRSLLREGDRVNGARVRDLETRVMVEVRAKTTALCTGPWINELLEEAGLGALPIRRTKGVHLILPALPTTDALIVPVEDDRVVFLIPWYGRTLVGTTDTDWAGDADHVRVEPADVDYLLRVTGSVLAQRWTRDDIIAGFAGLRTLEPGLASPASLSREWVLYEVVPGLMASIGGKLTSARSDAAAAVDRMLESWGRRPAPSPTAARPLPWAPPDARWPVQRLSRALELGLDEATADMCVQLHGARTDLLLDRVEAWPELARRIVADAPFCMAEVLHAVEHEMARSLADVLRRRVPLTLVAGITEASAAEVARLIAGPLGWDEERIREEVAQLVASPALAPEPQAV